MDKEAARARVAELVEKFARHESDYLRPDYNETQARTDFITPLLEAFGWDVYNRKDLPPGLREVIEEPTLEVEEERLSKKPDYELRLARQRKLFVEAKKPHVPIDRHRASGFQTRRYGYSASLPLSVLTNFHQLVVYDCRPAPAETDEAAVARLMPPVSYKDFVARFDELWGILSRQTVTSGEFDRRFAVGVSRRGAAQFDDHFLRQVRAWRERLAADIHANTPGLSPAQLTYAVQLFLSRIVFLRICEDREIEKYETLKNLDARNTFEALKDLLRRADAFYNSGLFRLLDDEALGVRIGDATLRSIVAELYYPQSPYTFAVVETKVLGEIYELFLAEAIQVSESGVEIVETPEAREGGGAVATPRPVVDAIVERTLGPAVAAKGPDDLKGFTVADVCCGSGSFLISAYEFLLNHYLEWYLVHDRASHAGRTIYEAAGGRWRLTLEEKRRILLEHVRGVDIDPNAGEVTRFSLLLKLIEDETAEDLRDFVARRGRPALPVLDEIVRWGNTLVSPREWEAALGPFPLALAPKVLPFDWAAEFRAETARGGFDAIVCNPPYIRIQNMASYSPEEVAYYKNPRSPYSTARQDNFDKYALYIERALTLLRPEGRLGVIVPHKFMSIQAGRSLRRLIAERRLLEQAVHFGVQQVFGPGTANYTCILVLDRRGCAAVRFEKAGPLEEWRYGRPGAVQEIPAAELTDAPWLFADQETRALFGRVRAAHPERLGKVADIFVGVQTSADPIYIFQPVGEAEGTLTLRWNGRDWPIERDILRPFLLDAPLVAYARPRPNAKILFPYSLEAGAGRVRAHLLQPDEMARRYPGCWAYLNARRAELEDRSVEGGLAAEKQWYQYGRSQSLTKFDGPKIILPILSLEPAYAYDEDNLVVTGGGNGPYYLIRPLPGAPVTNYFLLAVLNHFLSEALVRSQTSVFGGGYYSHGKQFIEDLPIPRASDRERDWIERAVPTVIALAHAVGLARTPHERTIAERAYGLARPEIEARVTALFGLSPADVEIARAVPVPS